MDSFFFVSIWLSAVDLLFSLINELVMDGSFDSSIVLLPS